MTTAETVLDEEMSMVLSAAVLYLGKVALNTNRTRACLSDLVEDGMPRSRVNPATELMSMLMVAMRKGNTTWMMMALTTTGRLSASGQFGSLVNDGLDLSDLEEQMSKFEEFKRAYQTVLQPLVELTGENYFTEPVNRALGESMKRLFNEPSYRNLARSMHLGGPKSSKQTKKKKRR